MLQDHKLIFDSEKGQKEKSQHRGQKAKRLREQCTRISAVLGGLRLPAPKYLKETLTEVCTDEILISINPAWHSLDRTVMFLSAGVRLL